MANVMKLAINYNVISTIELRAMATFIAPAAAQICVLSLSRGTVQSLSAQHNSWRRAPKVCVTCS